MSQMNLPLSEHFAVLVGGNFKIDDLIAAARCTGEIFAAALDALDGALQRHREVGDQRFLGVDVELGAEAAADFGRDRAWITNGRRRGSLNVCEISAMRWRSER